MKARWLTLFAAMGCLVLLLPGCTSSTSPTIPAVSTQQSATTPLATAAPLPDLTVRPGMTVKGKLESGADWGVTDDGHYFMGNPAAPVMFTEFSDYQ